MLSIQELGTQILGGNPGKFYILGGTEYGIKQKYIDILVQHYSGNYSFAETVDEVLGLMGKKHLIPLKPCVYVVRYDEAFVSSVNDNTLKKIQGLNIIGTVVCIYEASKHVTKLEKYLPDYTSIIDAVSPQFILKYLKSDFPNLPDRFLNIAVAATNDYNRSKNMCRCMSSASPQVLGNMSDSELVKLFGCYDASTESQIRKGVASRQFKYLVEVSEKYPDDADRILYAILQTMIELDKALDNKHAQSDVREYLKYWTREDIYYMFMNTYEQLNKLRSMSSYDVQNSLIYLFGLLKFQRIPSPEVMNS